MQSAFGIVVVVVCAVGVVGAIVALALGRRSWERYGSDLLVSDHDPSIRAAPSASGEREEEIRQLLAARNARRRRRGEPELDAERELARLMGGDAAPGVPPAATAGGAPGAGAAPEPAVDDELRSEIRALVIARNLRRARRGEAPLDVDAEVERQVADLSRL